MFLLHSLLLGALSAAPPSVCTHRKQCAALVTPPGQKAECVARQCMAVRAELPPLDPNQSVVWVGRSETGPQCEKGPVARDALPGNVILETSSPGVTPGPEWEKQVSAWETRIFNARPGSFQCEACSCLTFRRVYRLVLRDVPTAPPSLAAVEANPWLPLER